MKEIPWVNFGGTVVIVPVDMEWVEQVLAEDPDLEEERHE